MKCDRTISLIAPLLAVMLLAPGAPITAAAATDILAGHACGWATYAMQCAPPQPVKPSVCKAGSDPNDLQIHIVGPRRDTIEAYFKNEFFRYTFPDSQGLACGTEVVLAPKNELGTSAVVYGKHRDRLMAFGWKKGKNVPDRTREIVLETPMRITAKWVSTQVLKVQYGQRFQKSYIFRFNDADPAWNAFFQTGQPDNPLDPNSGVK